MLVLTTGSLALDQAIAQFRIKYVPIINKVLPGTKTATFFQTDRRLSTLIDVQLASRIPLMQEQHWEGNTMCAEVPDTVRNGQTAGEEKRTLKQKAYQGLKDFLVISLYLWVVFGLLVVYRSVVLSDGHFSLVDHGLALLNALALGKIMLIAQDLHFAEDLKGKPLIYSALYKAGAFAIVLGVFKIVEEAGIGWYHGKSFRQSIADIGGGTLEGILALVAILAVLLIPFFAFSELREVLGKERVRELFLRPENSRIGLRKMIGDKRSQRAYISSNKS